MQLSKFCSANFDLISIYRSKQGNQKEVTQLIKQLQNQDVPHIVVGDFNFHYLDEGTNPIKKFFDNRNYSQLIMKPTHTEGNILDHAYVRDEQKLLKFSAEVQTKYYTDHRGLALIVKQNEETL